MLRALLFALLTLPGRLPLGLRRFAGRRLGDIGRAVASKRRKVAARNLQMALPELSAAQRQKLLREHFHRLGESLMDELWMTTISGSRLRELIVLENAEALQKPRGTILLMPHFAGMNIAGAVLHYQTGGVMALYRPMHLAFWEAFFLRLRGWHGVLLVSAKDKDALRRCISHLRGGGKLIHAAATTPPPKPANHASRVLFVVLFAGYRFQARQELGFRAISGGGKCGNLRQHRAHCQSRRGGYFAVSGADDGARISCAYRRADEMRRQSARRCRRVKCHCRRTHPHLSGGILLVASPFQNPPAGRAKSVSMTGIAFAKMQSCGNDFVVIDAAAQVLPANISFAAIADRKRGIGCDQILILQPAKTQDADFDYRIINADGGEVGQCGNGARCAHLFLHSRGLTKKNKLILQTKTARITTETIGKEVRAHLAIPNFSDPALPKSQSEDIYSAFG